MPRRKNFDQLAAVFASAAHRQLGELKAAMRAAQATLAHARSSLHVPVIRPKRGRIAGGRSSGLSFPEAIAATIFGGFLDNAIEPDSATNLSGTVAGQKISASFSGSNLGSFQVSSGQSAAKLLSAALRGQRVR